MKARKNGFIFSRLFLFVRPNAIFVAALLTATLAACQSNPGSQTVQLEQVTRKAQTTNSAIAEPETVFIPAGGFISGSDNAERELGYRLDESAYGHSRTRQQKWYARERSQKRRKTKAYSISKNLITNKQYALFVQSTGYPSPGVSENVWRGYGLIHPYARTQKFAWRQNAPPPGREQHPVVLVNYKDAVAYAKWLGEQTGKRWRLPTELEWEKAARGVEGNIFPWGNEFDPTRLNSHDSGPFDTLPVGQFPKGQSPFGMLDAAGQVFEWTDDVQPSKRAVVKGGSWDDKGCGVCRAAARHTRPTDLKHILIGFRLVTD